MKKFIVTFAITGCVLIDAETKEDAQTEFDKISLMDLYEEAENSEITGVFEHEG